MYWALSFCQALTHIICILPLSPFNRPLTYMDMIMSIKILRRYGCCEDWINECFWRTITQSPCLVQSWSKHLATQNIYQMRFAGRIQRWSHVNFCVGIDEPWCSFLSWQQEWFKYWECLSPLNRAGFEILITPFPQLFLFFSFVLDQPTSFPLSLSTPFSRNDFDLD